IIISDGNSTDATKRKVRKLASKNTQIMLLQNPSLLSSSGRNVGFKNGRGEYFLVVDGHCRILNNKFIINLVDCFKKSGAKCLGRPQPFIIPNKLTMERAIALARSSSLGHDKDSFIHSDKEGFVSPLSVGCAYKKEIFEKIGYVDESFDACEDVEFNYRVEKAGFKSFFSPKIAVYYYPRKNLKGLFKQLVRYGEGRAWLIYKHPEMISYSVFLPMFFVIGIFIGPLFGLISRAFIYLYFMVLFLYFVILSAESFKLAKNNNLNFVIKIIAV
ncbi:glycosyltransferase family 2 protein, partial [Desulfobacteraceae bacterium SEEP-SAG9]